MVNFNCPNCQKSFSVKEEYIGRSVKCTACGTQFRVPAPPAPESGGLLGEDTGLLGGDSGLLNEPIQDVAQDSLLSEADLPSSPQAAAPQATAPQANWTNVEGAPAKKSLPVGVWIAVGAVVLVVLAVVAFMMIGNGGGDENASAPSPRRADRSGSEGSGNEKASPAALEQAQKTFADISSAIRKAQALDDIAELMKQNAKRREFIASAPKGDAEIDAWKQDYAVMADAEKLLKQAEYGQAVEMLQKRWDARSGAANLNGDLGLALAKASLAQQVLEDQWAMEHPKLQALLEKVTQGDPSLVEAQIMLAWTQKPEPKEELLRLELRPTLNVKRNKPLLKIKNQLSAIEDASLEEQVNGLLAMIDYSIGQSRRVVKSEYGCWIKSLSEDLSLQDAKGYSYHLMTNGTLLRSTEQGWQMLSNDGGRWTARPIALLLLKGKNPRKLTPPASRLVASSLISQNKDEKNGDKLCVYKSNTVSIDELWDLLSESYLETSLRGVQMAWAQAQQNSRSSSLMLSPQQYRNLFSSRVGNFRRAREHNAIFLPLRENDILPVVGDPESTTVDLIDKSYFKIDWTRQKPVGESWPDRLAWLPQANCFSLDMSGGGKVFFPTTNQKAFPQRMLRFVMPLLQQILASREADTMFKSFQKLLQQYPSHVEGANPQAILAKVAVANMSAEKVLGWNPDDARRKIEDADHEIRQLNTDIEELQKKQREEIDSNEKDRLNEEIKTKRESQRELEKSKSDLQRRNSQFAQAKLDCDQIVSFFGKALRGYRYGVTEAKNLVLCSAASNRRSVELDFYRENGEKVTQIGYNSRELEDVEKGRMDDFIQPSWEKVPNFSVTEFNTQNDNSRRRSYKTPRDYWTFLDFALKQAAVYAKNGNYHLALTLYREAPLPPMEEFKIDIKKSLNKSDVDDLAKRLKAVLDSAHTRLKANYDQAQVLEKCHRPDLARRLILTNMAECRIIIIPFFNKMNEYCSSYGYALPECTKAVKQIKEVLFEMDELRRKLAAAAQTQPATAVATPEGGKKAEWTRLTATWTPLMVDGEKVRRMTSRDIAVSPEWKAIYDSPGKVALLELAEKLRQAASKLGGKNLQAVVNNYNALGAMSLAICLDDANAGAARFNPAMLRFIRKDVETFFVSEMASLGVSQEKAEEWKGELDWILYQAENAASRDSLQYYTWRYYWPEYMAVMKDYNQTGNRGRRSRRSRRRRR